MRCLLCVACEDVVGLEGAGVRCACGRSLATREQAGWAYTGPSKVVLCLDVHEPEARRMGQRYVELPDDELSHRAMIEPLL
jgi:hypothetical protein